MKAGIALALTMGISCFFGCAAKSPEGIEAALITQDSKMKESVRRNRARAEKRQKWWSDYKYRNDRRYDSWVDSVLD